MPDWPIRFAVPAPATGLPQDSEAAGEEGQLRQHVEACARQLQSALWDWAVFCRKAGRLEEAKKALQRLIALVEDAESQAFYHLSLGQLLEQVGDFDAAIAAYGEALKQEPSDRDVAYFSYNNLGYCLNQRGCHEEAESYCRLAVAIDPERHNAHKNLGVSLKGQAKFAEAARCFVTAIQRYASDGRALRHLEQLVEEHPEVHYEWPDLAGELERCREAFRIATLIGNRIESPLRRNNQ